ncbi:MAG TPA: heme-binding protein [Polyangiaceae bacterium]|nr:heme-binding protein [Polyangiaceae bacterium]
MSKRTKMPWFWWSGAILAGAALARWQLARLFTEQPTYALERQIGPLEIRRYAPHCVAETRVSASSWDVALREGFQRLAGYIFGGNRRAERTSAPPGEAAREPATEKIDMTSPVQMRPERPENLARSYLVSFSMPAGRTPASLPQPNDIRVSVTTQPARRVAVLRYRGRYNGTTVAKKVAELLDYVRKAGLQQRGEPEFAGYDPPSTLPVLRRNEIWLDLA